MMGTASLTLYTFLVLYIHYSISLRLSFPVIHSSSLLKLKKSAAHQSETSRHNAFDKKAPEDKSRSKIKTKSKSNAENKKISSENVVDKDQFVATISSAFKLILKSNFKFAAYFTNPRDRGNNDEDTSIIDHPEKKFQFGMIDFDFEYNLNITNIILNMLSDERTKPVGILVKGPGGGKTRTLEELKMKYNEDIPNCLAVAITYNLRWTLDTIELESYSKELFPRIKDDARKMMIAVGLSMITRIMSMVYKTDLSDIVEDLKKYFPIQGTSYKYFELVLVALLVGIIEDIRERGGYPIDKFIILIDETKRIQEVILENNKRNPSDYLIVLRKSLLGRNLEKYAKVKTALTLSSLTTSNLYLSSPGRIHVSVMPPNRLTPELIVEKWWLPQLNIDKRRLSKKETVFLNLLASTCAQSPRATEVLGQEIANKFNNGFPIDLSFFKDLMDHVVRHLSLRYPHLALPTDQQMHALLFGYAIDVDDAIVNSIMLGSISNALNIQSTTIVPDVSVIMLAMAARLQSCVYHKYYIQAIIDLYESAVGQSVKDQDGRVMEKIMCSVFEMKLLCDLMTSERRTTFKDLLKIHPDIITMLPNRLYTCMNFESLPKESNPFIKKVDLPSFYKKGDRKKGFYRSLADPENVPTCLVPYIFFLSEKGERNSNSHDMMIAVYRGEDRPPFLIILEFKSRGVLADSQEPVEVFDLHSMPDSGEQYTKTKAQLMSYDIPKGISLDGLLKQVRSTEDPLPWIYLYMSTDKRYVRSYAVNNCVLLASKDVYEFLGPFQYVYTAAKGIYQLDIEEEHLS